MKRHGKAILALAIVSVFVAAGLSISGLTGVSEINAKAASPAAPVEKSGQTKSYATGDDGDPGKGAAWPVPRFIDNENGTITDRLTGLIWLKQANYKDTSGGKGTSDRASALAFCNALASGMCGLSDGSAAGDWRLPNVRELESLLDYGRSAPALKSEHPFTGVQPAYYWSATTSATSSDIAWYVCMSEGVVHYDGKMSGYYVWPVRGGAGNSDVGVSPGKFYPAPVEKTGQTTSYGSWDDGDLEKGVALPVPRFIDNGNGTVTDALTGLVWLKNADCFGLKKWPEAVKDCISLENGVCGLSDGSAKGDWRPPSIKELRSLINHERYNPAFFQKHPFAGLQSGNYWSGTSNAEDPASAWHVNVYSGSLDYDIKLIYPCYVWPVRGGE